MHMSQSGRAEQSVLLAGNSEWRWSFLVFLVKLKLVVLRSDSRGVKKLWLGA